MKFFARIIFQGCANIVAFYAISSFISAFEISNSFLEVATAAALLTLVNIFIRPIIKLILSPFIFITFGLFVIVINAFLLYAVDIYSSGITISEPRIQTLIVTAIILSVVNVLMSSSAKSLFQKPL